MAIFTEHHWANVFGVLGNAASVLVYLSPIPSFYRIYKKKSIEGFQAYPYVIALFSSMLWIYYALLKGTTYIITINAFGCFIETIYIILFLLYAQRKARMKALKVLFALPVFGFGLMCGLTMWLIPNKGRAIVVGWICLVSSVCVFVAPLCVLGQVIKTKSVEYMPILLSIFLAISAVMWFFYGLIIRDINIAIPNVLGFSLGVAQIVLYMCYKDGNKIEKITENEPQVIVLGDEKISQTVKLAVLLPDDIHIDVAPAPNRQ